MPDNDSLNLTAGAIDRGFEPLLGEAASLMVSALPFLAPAAS
jgi:hypothetical protein